MSQRQEPEPEPESDGRADLARPTHRPAARDSDSNSDSDSDAAARGAAAASSAPPPFHLAFPVRDLAAARAFYGELLGCPEGRSSDSWVDFDFRGHQLVAHLVLGHDARGEATHQVDGEQVPCRHFGLVLPWAEWEALAARLRAAGTTFAVRPHIRFTGRVGEQATLFIHDPSGNALEFKAFRDPRDLFARQDPLI